MNTSNRVFYLCLALLGGTYVALIVAMLAADLFFTAPGDLIAALASPDIRYAIRLSLVSCTISTLFALWVAVPLGYLLARTSFPGKAVVDTLLDVPIVLPPLVIGLSLLILFQTEFGQLRAALHHRHLRDPGGDPGAVLGVGCVRGADDARHLRAAAATHRAGGTHARLFAAPGILAASCCRKHGPAS